MRANTGVTIKDVAKKAGVAVSTVSRVINNLEYVSDKTREKVLAAIIELGYIHDSIAASMKTGKTRMIVVVVPDLINDFFSSVVQGVEGIFNQRGYFTLVFTTNESSLKEQQLFEGVFGKLVDGAILIPATESPEYYKSLKIPIVLVDRTLGQMSTVVIDNYKGAYLATKELLDHGHNKIAVLNGDRNRDFGILTNRYDGFLAAMNEAGVPVKNDYVRFCSWEQNEGYLAMQELLSLNEPPTAVFATNSQLCIGCIKCLRKNSLIIGKDISLVSFDDSLLAELNDPPITVVSRPTIAMGQIAAKMLLNLLERKPNPHNRYMLDVKLSRRQSVKKII